MDSVGCPGARRACVHSISTIPTIRPVRDRSRRAFAVYGLFLGLRGPRLRFYVTRLCAMPSFQDRPPWAFSGGNCDIKCAKGHVSICLGLTRFVPVFPRVARRSCLKGQRTSNPQVVRSNRTGRALPSITPSITYKGILWLKNPTIRCPVTWICAKGQSLARRSTADFRRSGEP